MWLFSFKSKPVSLPLPFLPCCLGLPHIPETLGNVPRQKSIVQHSCHISTITKITAFASAVLSLGWQVALRGAGDEINPSYFGRFFWNPGFGTGYKRTTFTNPANTPRFLVHKTGQFFFKWCLISIMQKNLRLEC